VDFLSTYDKDRVSVNELIHFNINILKFFYVSVLTVL
jgi:hypothetical protein